MMLRHHRRRFGEQNAIGIDQTNLRALTKKRNRFALHYRDSDLVRQQTHDCGVLDPRNLLELFAALRERHKEDVAPDIFAEYGQHLCAAHLSQARRLDIAGACDAETSVVLEEISQRVSGDGDDRKHSYDAGSKKNAAHVWSRVATSAERVRR